MYKRLDVKTEKGFAAQDILVAMFVLVLFLGVMTAVYVNLSNTSYEIKKMTEATKVSTAYMEYLDKLYFYDIDSSKTSLYINAVSHNGFTPEITVTDREDGVKSVEVTINYEWKGESYSISNSILKFREMINPQNSPNFDNCSYTPIKYVYSDSSSLNGYFVKTTADDSDWYNYDNNLWAVAVSNPTFITNSDGEEVLDSYSKIYLWIPRYYINASGDIEFLYKDGFKRIAKNTEAGYCYLLDLETNYNSSNIHPSSSGVTGTWVEVTASDDNLYQNITSSLSNSDFDNLKDDSNYNLNNTRIPV